MIIDGYVSLFKRKNIKTDLVTEKNDQKFIYQLCKDTKYYPRSNTAALFFEYNSNSIRKLINCKDDKHKEFLLSLKGCNSKLRIVKHSKESRIVELIIETPKKGWITIYSKNKSSSINLPNQVKKEISVIDKLLNIEYEILGEENLVKLSNFLYENKEQFDLALKFLSDYDTYIKIFCSKYGFFSQENALKNHEYIIEVPLSDYLWRIAKRRCNAKCKRFSINDPNKIKHIIKNEIQGVIGEQTKVIFFNALWEFLSINKRINVNDNIYDNTGDGGIDFMVGIFDIDVKHRNRPPNADLLLNKSKIDTNTLILLITCLTNHVDEYYYDLYNFADYLIDPDGRLTHQSVLVGYTDSYNYNSNSTQWRNLTKKWSLAYYDILPIDNYIKLMIIEALKEEIVKL